jgi:glycerol-3-phosphate O-acyltransferase/dihydroxyacetone phosphate acyltransferase
MLYNFLKFLFGFSLRVFYRNIQIKGLENIPKKGPVIIVSNHPNTIMDPISIATSIDRDAYFLAKAVVFKSSFAKWFLPKLNLIPVNRAQDDPAMMENNEQTFLKTFEHLEDGKLIMIFPEGISMNHRKLKKIKTGAARIALGAEERNNFELGVQIICIGLTYSSHHRFRSDLFINIDTPIDVRVYRDEFKKDQVEAVKSLTDEIRFRLESKIVAIQDEQIDKFVKQIETIYKSQLLKELGFSSRIREHDFLVTKAISEVVEHFYLTDPERVQRIRADIDHYFESLNRISLSEHTIKKFSEEKSVSPLLNIFYFLTGFPLFLFGVFSNYLPFKLPEWIALKISPREYKSSVTLLFGILTFTLFYFLQLWLVQRIFENIFVTICYLILMPLSGFFAFFYWRRFTSVMGKWKLNTYFYRRRGLINSIIELRQEIIDELDKGRSEYLKMN